MPAKIFAISGKAASGKTTLAWMLKDYIEKNMGLRAMVFPFASMIKQFASIVFGVSVDEFSREKGDVLFTVRDCDVTKRQTMQCIGDAIRKVLGVDTYYKCWLDKMHELCVTNRINILIIDDMRFVDEFEFVKSLSHCSDLYFVGLENIHTDSGDCHVSESGVPGRDKFMQLTEGFESTYSTRNFDPSDGKMDHRMYDDLIKHITSSFSRFYER